MGVMTLLDLATLFWVSQWMGLTARQPNRASANSLALVFFPTWVMVFLVAMANIAAGSGTGGWQPYFSLWFLVGAVADIALAVWAYTRLRERFRSAAQKRFEPTKGLMEIVAGK
jgi:Na+/melibiose symporter-like transporter